MTRAKKTASPAERWLGKEVQDLLSGMTGYCNSVSQQSNGNIAVGIQPKGDGKDHPDAHLFDEATVVEHGVGISAKRQPIPKPAFAIGDRVEHRVAPYGGVVASLHWFLNGCIQYVVTSDVSLGENGRPVWESFSEAELQATPKAKKVDTAQTKTGGPSTRVERALR